MKTETEVTIEVGDLIAENCLNNEIQGFRIKIFLACSRVTTKIFRLTGEVTPLAQTLKISNITGKELQFWLCTTRNKIIANAVLALPKIQNQQQSAIVELKMASTLLARLSLKLSVSTRQIQKIVYVEPDEQLLKKVQDPYQQKRRQQQQLLKKKQLQQQQNALKQVKKSAITISKFNKKDIPFI